MDTNGSILIHDKSIQALTNNLSEAVHVVQDYNIVHANEASVHMHGFDSISEVIGRDVFSLGILRREAFKKAHEEHLAGLNVGETTVLSMQSRDGHIFPIQHCPYNILWNGHPAVLSVVIDLSRTARRAAKEFRQFQTRHFNNNIAGLGIVGKSKAMKELYEAIIQISANNANVLILGESGAGKELIARLIHNTSNHYQGDFVALNCAAINNNLLESEFFGHKKGAFTGALSNKTGYFEAADKGTLFLDEIGDLTPESQIKLLRFFDSGEYIPVGSVKPRKSNARIIMATNKDPVRLVEKGLMREDFFYRIHIIVLHVPPLRERMEDLPILIDHFLEQTDYADSPIEIPDKVMKAFSNYYWPGNIRELQNVLTRYTTLGHIDFYPPLKTPGGPLKHITDMKEPYDMPVTGMKMKSSIEALERIMIAKALTQTHGNKSRAAELLDIPRRTFLRKIKNYGIE